MAITIKGFPDVFSPAFNPIYYYLDSTNKTEEGFKYVVDIYRTGTADLLASYKLFPRPVDGYGVCDVNQILKSQLSEDIEQVKGPRESPNVYECYDIEFGEEFIYYWDWTDTEFVGGSSIYSGKTKVVSTGTSNTFVAGDIILLEQNPGDSANTYNGIFTVLSANSSTLIIDAPFVVSPTVGGTAVFSDKRKTLFQDLTGFTGNCVFNGAVAHQEFMNYSSNDYNAGVNSGATFLTNIPAGYRVKPDNTMRLDWYSSTMTGCSLSVGTQTGKYDIINVDPLGKVNVIGAGPADITATEVEYDNNFGSFPIFKNICYPVLFITDFGGQTLFQGFGTTPWNDLFYEEEYVEFQDDNGQVYGSFIVDLPTSDSIVLDVPYSAVSASTGTLIQRTDWYTLTIFNGFNQALEPIRFNVDWSTTRYGNIELVFMDRLGSYAPANFELQSFRTINVTRDSYKKILGDLNRIDISDKWQYRSTDRGKQNINTQVIQVLDLTSNWLTEEEANYLQELYSSPFVYIKDNGQLWPVVVTTNSYQVQTKKNKKNIQIKITVEYANNDIINNVQ